jgi:hypothetical protein
MTIPVPADDFRTYGIDWWLKPVTRNPFAPGFKILQCHAPVVIQTVRKFDAPYLVKILVEYFGIRQALSAAECVELPEIQESMGAVSAKSLGGRLGEIAGEDFGGYRIEKIDEERGVAIWWVCEST